MKTTVELQVGKPVTLPIYKNVYELVTDYMHGDADGYTDKTKRYDAVTQIDRLKLDLLSLEAIDEGVLDECEDILRRLYEKLGVEDVDGEIDGFRDNFYEGDNTTDGSMAAHLDGVTLFYYDENSVKHNVVAKFK